MQPSLPPPYRWCCAAALARRAPTASSLLPPRLARLTNLPVSPGFATAAAFVLAASRRRRERRWGPSPVFRVGRTGVARRSRAPSKLTDQCELLFNALTGSETDFQDAARRLSRKGVPDPVVIDGLKRHLQCIFGVSVTLQPMGSAARGTTTLHSDFDFFFETDREVKIQEMRDLQRRLQEHFDELGISAHVEMGRLALTVTRDGVADIQIVPSSSEFFNFDCVALPCLYGSTDRKEADRMLRDFLRDSQVATSAVVVLKNLLHGLFPGIVIEHLVRQIACRSDSLDSGLTGLKLCKMVLDEFCRWDQASNSTPSLDLIMKDARAGNQVVATFWEYVLTRASGVAVQIAQAQKLDQFSPLFFKLREAVHRAPADKPRGYQIECIQEVSQGNRIIHLPTGRGKTLVVVAAIDSVLARQHNSKALFVVPTRALVSQQAGYLRAHSTAEKSLRVTELVDDLIVNWGLADWDRCVRECDVLVGTAEVVRRALVDHGFLRLTQFKVLVFDECHRAIGNHPVAQIMYDAFLPTPPDDCPRLIGLTASLVTGSLKNAEDKRMILEGMLQAPVFSPKSVDVHVPDQCKERITWRENAVPDLVHPRVCAALSLNLQTLACLDDKGLSRVRRDAMHVLEELGFGGFLFFVREGIIKQLEASAISRRRHPEGSSEPTRKNRLASLGLREQTVQGAANLSDVQSELRRTGDELAGDTVLLENAPDIANKCGELLRILREEPSGKLGELRVIVFVQQVALTYPLAYIINRELGELTVGSSQKPLRAAAASGGSSMSDAVRERALQQFRSGDAAVLVCTDAMEEGVDVPDCGVVVRFSGFATTRSHIQGKGRARAQSSRIYYFDNNPAEEDKRSEYLTRITRDKDYGLTPEEMQDAREALAAVSRVERRHPYYPKGARSPAVQINLYICINIFYDYVTAALKQEFDPASLYEFVPKEGEGDQAPTVLKSVKYPSADGWEQVSAEAVNEYWRDIDLDNTVWRNSRARNLTPKDKEQRRFVFVACVRLSQAGLLTAENLPAEKVSKEAFYTCVSLPRPQSGKGFRSKFDPASLSRSLAAAAPLPAPSTDAAC